ncbi:MAG: choice-of-anchor Q domain-containing protein, partial [Thermoflexales bacterium]
GTYNVANLESVNSTFSGNSAPNGGGLRSVGGTAYLTHTTIASNTSGAGVVLSSGSVQAAAALLAYNGGGNCNAALVSVGNSLSSDSTCNVAISNTDPLLQPLALNGGPTLNHALAPSSPAINAASACSASDDQRGVPRPQGLACDIGAFERELPDLAVSKSAQPVPALAGQPVTYTVVVTNLSAIAPASGIILTDTLDGNAIFGGVVNGGGFALSSSTFTQAVFSLSSLPAGASTTLVFTATAPTSGIFTNTVQVASADVDANPADNVFTITTPVTGAVNLRVTKFATPSPALPGQDVFYVVTLKNLGASVATNVVITDVFQGSGVVFAGLSGLSSGVSLQSSSANGVTFTLSSLNPLGTAVMIYRVASSQVGVITNTATASADQAEVDPADNSATVFTLVSHLVINKAVNTASPIAGTVAPSGLFTYTLAVSNLGPNAANNITVTDALPAGVGFVSALGFGWTCNESALTVTCTRPTLGVGAAPPIQIVVTAPVTAGLALTNTATVTSDTYPAVVASNDVVVTVQHRVFAPIVRKDP